MDKTIKKIAIVGLGLIGGSLAKDLNSKYRILGMDSNAESVEYALKNNIVHETASEYSELIGCSVIFVCVSVYATCEVVRGIYAAVGDSAIISDVASVKGILEDCGGRIVGGHPMAGTEFSGIKAAKDRLFNGACYYIVKYKNTADEDCEVISRIAEQLGARPKLIGTKEHDKLVSRTSHLPHMAAYALGATAISGSNEGAGSGLMDTTRIASSDPKFWASVARLNRDNLLEDMRRYIMELSGLSCLLQEGDFEGVERYFAEVKAKRDALGK